MEADFGAGFAEPVRDAARAFRAVLDAMARPGRIVRPPLPDAPPSPLSPAAAAALLTVADDAARVWLAPGHARPAVERWLRFHTGSAPVARPQEAAFAVGRWAALAPAVAEGAFAVGAPDYPDRSTTLVVEVDGFAAGAGARLTGPGIAGEARLAVDGVDAAFWAMRAADRARFPLGRDVILTAGGALAALPRSTRADV